MSIRIELTWEKITGFIMMVLLLVMILLICCSPYFEFGEKTITLTPAEGAGAMLTGNWSNGVKAGKDGYYSLTFVDKKNILVTEQKNGVVTETTAKYKYKKSDGTLTLTFFNEAGQEIKVEPISFIPEISFGSIQHLSIMEYITFSYEHEDFTKYLSGEINGYFINDTVGIPILLLTLAAICIVCYILFYGKVITGILVSAFSIFGIFGYLTNDFLRIGQGRTEHVVWLFVLLAFSVLHIVMSNRKRGSMMISK
jgi:hypothetical protein